MEPVKRLACPHLRQLQFHGLYVKLGPGNMSPGVLRDCTALTALELHNCRVIHTRSEFAAIAVLPELQQLRILTQQLDSFSDRIQALPAFQHPRKLTHLSISFAAFAEDI
jgi:hypothetical protein